MSRKAKSLDELETRIGHVFADKAIGKPKPVTADYVGLTVPNKFVVGFGMDAHGYWRNLPEIWALQPEEV